jgi:hypothetical protein
MLEVLLPAELLVEQLRELHEVRRCRCSYLAGQRGYIQHGLSKPCHQADSC